MANITELVSFLDTYLETNRFKGIDHSRNGLQVESSNQTIKKVGLAVDCGLSIIEKAISEKVDFLIVHHGLFWGSGDALTGTFGAKIRLLIENGCSLYCSHLPLDGHMEVGNNVLLAHFFGLQNIVSSFAEQNIGIGVIGELKTPQPFSFFVEKARTLVGCKQETALPFGPQEIKKVGIVSGGAAGDLAPAAEMGCDLYITGEPKQSVYHLAKELKINALFPGHYATETVGVRAVGDLLAKKYHVATTFIDEPTGI